ncbi:glutamate racemase [Pantoea agglomerans]|uniref:glutamate racemase n=1 Tax=Enterobacter agglomerans TaxID=549 RepID=UPI00289C0B95|nr:glutamate racemase [Pantoea agglomerans]WNK53668.1 glutamate racemase [Pantoea agglomerans]
MAISHQDESITSAAATTSDLRPTVLVFDSGVGGLSVYDEVRQLLPDLHYLYAFDNAGFPYGEKSETFIVERVVAIVEAITRSYPLSLVIIACNTASTVSLPALRERFAFPVVGVVPAIKPAARLTRNGVVGLLATRATVRRPYTHELVSQFAGSCKIEMLGSAELVELAEAKLHGAEVALDEVRRIVQPWLRMAEPPDTVVLGCTHFPLLREELQQVLPEGTRLIDSGAAIARRTAWLLEHEAPEVHSSQQNVAFCTELDGEAVQLSPVLRRYGFSLLEKLAL